MNRFPLPQFSIVTTAASFLLLAAAVPGAAIEFSNRYVNVVLNDNGRFTIGTVEGDPSRSTDNNKDLLYGHPGSNTSDTIVRIDGVNYDFGSTGTPATAPSQSGNSLVCAWDVAGGVQVRQTLAVVRSNATRNEDTVEIKYTLTNNGASTRNVALRLQLDTLLGDNDGAPFRVPDYGEVTSDAEWDNNPATTGIPVIPQFCHVFDNLSNPTIFSMLTLTGIGYRTPDRFVLGYWPVSNGRWDYTVVSGRSFTSDSSAVVWWGYPGTAIALAPGESVNLAIHYGLSDLAFAAWSPFNIGFTSPAELTLLPETNTYQYTPNPFTVVTYLENTSQGTVTNASITLNLPPEFVLQAGEQATKSIETAAGTRSIAAGASTQVVWRAVCNGRFIGDRRLSVTVDANGGSKTLVRRLAIPGAANAVYGTVFDGGGAPVAGATVVVLSGQTTIARTTSGSDGKFLLPVPPGVYDVKVTAPGFVPLLMSATVGAETASVNPVLSNTAVSRFEAFCYPNPAREGSAAIRFTGIQGDTDVKIFDAAGNLVTTIPVNAAAADQWQEVRWGIDDVANGVYFYRIKGSGAEKIGTIVVLKRSGMK